eukprot:m.196854 g.196854  ORF g.196854 m.196854 type:complete len:80 (-) comp16821_c0_seq3:9002-9241(-)
MSQAELWYLSNHGWQTATPQSMQRLLDSILDSISQIKQDHPGSDPTVFPTLGLVGFDPFEATCIALLYSEFNAVVGKPH